MLKACKEIESVSVDIKKQISDSEKLLETQKNSVADLIEQADDLFAQRYCLFLLICHWFLSGRKMSFARRF